MLCFVESWAEVITSRTKLKYIIEFTHSGNNSEDVDYIATIQGGHLGINKTTEKISSRYYWPNIKEDITSFIHTCEKCQRVNESMMKTHIELHPISIPTKIFSQVGIDLMSLTESKGFDEDGRYKYLISAQCYFSKYVEVGTLKTKKAEEVSKWIYNQIICRYGVTDIHITDNGSEFAKTISPKKCTKNWESI